MLGQDGKPEPFSSYYNLFFNHYIREYPYGEAHRRADLEVKQRVGCDAELWISGPQGGAAVKGL